MIGQINFADIPPLPDGARLLPERGILYLFLRQLDSAADPVELVSHRFDGDPATLRRTDTPSDDPERFCEEEMFLDLRPTRVSFHPTVSLPEYDRGFRDALEAVAGQDDQQDALYKLYESLEAKGEIGQILGFANTALAPRGLYRKVYYGRIGKRQLVYNDYWKSLADFDADIADRRARGNQIDDERAAQRRADVAWKLEHEEEIARGAAEWRLLLRIDSNRAMGLSINDADPLYVFVRDAPLAAGDFSDLAGEVTQG